MTTNKSTSGSKTQDARSASSGSNRSDQPSSHGKQGFASMPKEKVQEIARKGGEHSHDRDSDRNRG